MPLETAVNCEDVSSPENPRVFFDISIDGCPAAERIIIELFANVVPITAENFRVLCTGEKSTPEKHLHYKGTVFDYIIKGFIYQGGATSNDKYGGESCYGGYFKDENFQLRHSVPGLLSMAGYGKDANGSRFYIISRPMSCLDGICVVFGKVVGGLRTLDEIGQMGTPVGKPRGVVEISNCGEVKKSCEGEKKKVEALSDADVEKKKRRKSNKGKKKPSYSSFGLARFGHISFGKKKKTLRNGDEKKRTG